MTCSSRIVTVIFSLIILGAAIAPVHAQLFGSISSAITDVLKSVLRRDGKLHHVTVVPVAYGYPVTTESDPEGFLKYENVQLITYD